MNLFVVRVTALLPVLNLYLELLESKVKTVRISNMLGMAEAICYRSELNELLRDWFSRERFLNHGTGGAQRESCVTDHLTNHSIRTTPLQVTKQIKTKVNEDDFLKQSSSFQSTANVFN